MKLVLLLFIFSTVAFPCLQKTFPSTVKVQEAQLILNGVGMRLATFLNIKVYAAGLYLPEKAQNLKAIKAIKGPKFIDLYFLRDVDKDDIVKAWKKAPSLKGFPSELSTFNSFMEEMKKETHGIQLEIHQDGLLAKVAGQSRPKIKNAAFADAILDVFLGPNSPNEELREGMLGSLQVLKKGCR